MQTIQLLQNCLKGNKQSIERKNGETTYQKKSNPFGNAIVNFFVTKELFYNDDIQQKMFLVDC
jgi:hypothetical protein